MCYAYVEVKWKVISMPTETFPIQDEAALIQRLDALQSNDQVERIRVFSKPKTYTRKTIWAKT